MFLVADANKQSSWVSERVPPVIRPRRRNHDDRCRSALLRSSVLRYQTYVYNAVKDTSPADVEIQTTVLRDHRPVVTMPPAKLPTDTTKDLRAFPIRAEISLNQLPPGRYASGHRDRSGNEKHGIAAASFVIE